MTQEFVGIQTAANTFTQKITDETQIDPTLHSYSGKHAGVTSHCTNQPPEWAATSAIPFTPEDQKHTHQNKIRAVTSSHLLSITPSKAVRSLFQHHSYTHILHKLLESSFCNETVWKALLEAAECKH